MTKEEAIKRLEFLKGVYSVDMETALDMAIDELSADTVSLTGTMKYLTQPHNYCEVVRCKDCRYRKKVGTSYYCELDEFNVKDTDFCSWGERREEVNGFKSVGQAWNTSQERRYE